MTTRKVSGKRYVITRRVNGRVWETLGTYYYRGDAERMCPAGFVVETR